MKIGTGALVAAVLALTLSGCAAESPSSPSPSPSVEATANEASTVQQWASLIAQQQAEWQDWETSWDEANCSSIEASMEHGIICRLQFLSASAMTNTTTIQYELATTPGRKGFIAEVPNAEVASLFEATVSASTAARDAGDAWSNAECSTVLADECGGLAFQFESAIDDLLSEFDAWAPYI